MKHLYVILIAVLTIFSCKQKQAIEEGDYAYLGGEVISPIDDFVVLKKSDEILDTVKLDNNNRFLYKFKDLEPGLYSFNLKSTHGKEFQIVILEPKDSIMFRINTRDFDESLVYTGNGAKKNNYLIDMFLECETDEHKIFKLSKKLAAEEFQSELDSLTSAKAKKLEDFKTKYNFENESLFSKVAQANIDLNYNLSKEIYPFVYFGYKKIKNIEALPSDFYSYRANINYNDDLLKDYFSYFRFLEHHFNNLALKDYFKDSEHCVFDKKSLSYNLTKLELIDSLVTHPKIKNRLLYYSVGEFLDKNTNYSECDSVLKFFTEKCTDTEKKEKILAFSRSLKSLKPGDNFPNLEVINHKNETVSFNDIINKPTIVFFWSSVHKWHFKEVHYKVKKLKEENPDKSFIAISVNENSYKDWQNMLSQYKLPSDNQYKFKNLEDAKKALALYAINKVFIINKESEIVNGNANIFDSKFEKQLATLK